MKRGANHQMVLSKSYLIQSLINLPKATADNSTHRNNCTAGVCKGMFWNSWFQKIRCIGISKQKYNSKTLGMVKRNNFLLIFKRK